MGLDHYPASLLPVVAPIYEELARDFREVFGVDLDPGELSTVVRFGSWVGGDRDGNPFVDPESTRATLQKARELILSDYLDAVEQLRRLLTPSTFRVGVSAPLREALESYIEAFPEEAREVDALPECEPYRRFLGFIRLRLRRSLTEPGGLAAYPGASATCAATSN